MGLEFENVLIIGPSSKRKGGIASVIKNYKENFNAHYFSSTNFQNTYLSFLFLTERLLALSFLLLIKKEIMIVHIHGSHKGSFLRKYLIFKVCNIFKKKIVYHIHSGTYHLFFEQSNRFLKQKIVKLIEKSNGIIVLSESWKHYFQETFDIQNIFVIPNIIANPQNVEAKFKNSGRLRIIYLGKIFKEKGIYDLLDCIIENYDTYVDKVSFIIAGNGEAEKIETYKNLDSKGIISFVGWVINEQKNELLLNSDVLILPSYNEGLPVSVLEGMSYKMPIIATSVGGIPEIVVDGFNGKIVTPGNLKEIHEAITFYLKNRNLISIHGENSFKRAKQYFPEKIKLELLNVYNSV